MVKSKKRDYSNWSQQELIEEIEHLRKQKTYGLVFDRDKIKEEFDYYMNFDGENAKEIFNPEVQKKFPLLKEVSSKHIISDENEMNNLLIEGDNYHSLITLNFTHQKQIDVIYIDPPYNTGNKDFIYNDKYVDKEDSFRHSKWLNFMEKRLKLARNLLKDSGVIFISIDDNEQAQLKILCDEIFGEDNFVSQMIWKKRSGGGYTNSLINNTHEYVFVYAKNVSNVKFNDKIKDEETLSKKYPCSDSKSIYKRRDFRKSGSADLREDRPTMYFAIKSPDGKNIFPIRPDGRDGRWSYSKEGFQRLLKNQNIEFVKVKGTWKVYSKERPFDDKGELKKEKYESLLDNVALNTQGSNELKSLFPENDTIFDYPKPTNLIKYILKLASKKNSTILDFMAGSGTTGQAILDLNNNDGGNRKFILCTNNENNICEQVCYPRIKKIINGYKDNKNDVIEGLGGNLRYFKTDFVDSEITDENKKKIVDKSTEMICIKENAFEEVENNDEFKIFKNNKFNLGIIFEDYCVEDFVEKAKKIKGKFKVYCFTLDGSLNLNEFKDIKDRVKLSPIPEAILHIYRRVIKE